MARLSEKEYESYKTSFEGMSYKELGETFKSLDAEIQHADNELKKLKEARDILALKVVPEKLDGDDISSVNLESIGRIGLTFDMHVNVPVKHREEWHSWLKENGHGGLIKDDPTIASGTQKAFIKEQYKAGEELPEYVKAEPFFRASLTKR